jgi:hypothetical protein
VRNEFDLAYGNVQSHTFVNMGMNLLVVLVSSHNHNRKLFRFYDLGAMLQAGRSWVAFPIRPAALWPRGRLSLYQQSSWG